ncbi:ciliogenesis and planar polarity effector 1 isoform 2-T2 [Leptodactylus fuscus]|uniref:ciliogenesis and planar polarity effector 1 isoform X2 n=1 Tax=Leptodactylus fuscus TaxID=238119 RepID=UPI003F4E9421
MDVSLEVLLSTSIKRKKPCVRLCWLGQEKEGVFLVDERQVCEIKLRSGSVKKTILKKSNVVTLATSDNGAWLAALHLTGELSLWNKDADCLQIVPTNDVITKEIVSAQGISLRLHLYVCGDGRRVLLATHSGSVYLWENTEEKPHLIPQKKRVLPCRWSRIEHGDDVTFPGVTDKEATVHAVFIKSEVLGDCCLCTFVSYLGPRLVMTFLALRWFEKDQKLHSATTHHVHWAKQEISVTSIAPSCAPVKSRGSLLARFSQDGLVLTLALNQKNPKETRVLFINTMNFVTVCGSLRGCGSREQQIPSRLLRSYWVADMSWTADSLFLACMLKRGSLLLLTRMGELLTLTTFGCSVEFGPAEFIPLHPFITYRPPVPIPEAYNPEDSLGSVTSEADVMRQRYSVTCHSRLPYIMVSDGYMVTTLRFAENLSPQNFMKGLLLDTAQRLENVRHTLQIGKSKKNGIKLRPLASLKATLLKDPCKPPSAGSTLPSFLQEEEEICGHLEKLLAQEDSEESDNEEYCKFAVPADAMFSRAEQGRLEFASMFDTIHANEQYTEKSDVLGELLRIQRTILTAWAVGVSMGSVAQTGTLLHYTVGCLTHFLSILQSPKCPELKPDKPSKKKARGDPWTSYVSILHQCLTVLYWDVAPRQTIGHVVKLTAETIKLILVQQRPLRSKSLLESFCLLQMVSRSLSAIYTARFESISMEDAMDDATRGDCLRTPVFKAIKRANTGSSLQCIITEAPNGKESMKSEKRLTVLWRLLYHQTLCYQTRLRKQISLRPSAESAPEVQNEEKAIGFLLCHIQAEIQCGEGYLSGSVRLLPVTGEEYFLLGSYKESVDFWKKAIQETTARGGRRSGLLQTRYYLALLYCHLYHYNLNDAQGMCDQMVRELLIRSSLLPETEPSIQGEIPAGNPPSGRRPLQQVHPDAALAVIRSMGRFMAAYFTNHLLYVFPPHNVCVLAPLPASTEKLPRVVPLQHGVVAAVVRDQNLSSVWTVEYTLDLLLVSGLISEAAWLANKLGDWKMSVSMSVAYNLQRSSSRHAEDGEKGEFPVLSPAHVFQEKLQSFLGHPPNSEAVDTGHTEPKQFTDPIEEEDADVLFSSVQEMLKAAVMADAEILTETLHQLTEAAKELGRKLSGLVPERLYLPAPPLYCPQPTSVSEEDPSDLLLELEKRSRQKLSSVLQRILLLLRAARCSLPAAQWYIKQIKRARKIMQKIRAKASLPPLESLPENLLNYANSRTVLLKPGPGGEPVNDLVSCSVVVCFRELCALCWMLHVRERLSISCRQYQKARDNGKLFKSADGIDSCVIEHCFEALEWACRMLPFTRATNCEELIQDLILSLVSELPPVKKVAEIMVRAFPNPEDVRVPLREKYQSVQQRLRHSKIRGLHGEEMMSVTIHNMQRVRVKTLRRVQRNIGAVEMHLWEPPLDDPLGDESHCYDKYSLGTTSLSRSTLTDLGRPQIYSDTDTISDALMWTGGDGGMDSTTPADGAANPRKPSKPTSKKPKAKRVLRGESGPSPPTVGTWEFECNDDEYPGFLDLFLSYLLERDLLHSTEPGIPFLTTFSPQLREHELNSLVFDVHTTLKRKLVSPCEYTAAPVIEGGAQSVSQNRSRRAVEYLEPEISPPHTVHELEDESEEEEDASNAASEVRQSPERPSGLQEKSHEGASVLGDPQQLDQSLELSETEDDQEDETQRSMTIAVSIRPVQQENLPCDSKPQDPEETADPKLGEETQISAPPVSAACSSPTPQSVSNAATYPPPPAAHQPEPTNPDGGRNPQPSTSSEAVRQLLQDEMFRLLQLQQINFMSLMQVVGSSFAAMPALQHILEQTSQIGRNPVLNPAGERSTLQVITPTPAGNTAAVPVPDTQQEAESVWAEGGVITAEKTAKNEQSNKENVQKLPELLIPPHQADKTSARPGLFSMAPHHGLPLITPPSGPPKTPTLIRPPAMKNQNGFPLLKLQPEPQFVPINVRPPVREAWAPLRMTAPVPTPRNQPTGVSEPSPAQRPQRWAEPVTGRPAVLQSSSHMAAHEQNKAAMRLLHLRSDPVLYIPPLPNPGIRAPTLLHLAKDVSKLTLLRTDVSQQRPADERRRDPAVTEESRQRMNVNIPPPSEHLAKAEDSIKRKNRRSLKEKNEKKKAASVTFRPEDSIIAPNNLDEVTRSEIVHHDKQDLKEGSEFVIPLGSFDSMLSHHIPHTPASSAAELHLMASTWKRPPDIRDASTNTDPDSHKPLKGSGMKREEFPRSMAAAHVDPEVLPPGVQEQRPPELFLNLQYPDEVEEPLSHFGYHIDEEESPDSAAQDLPSAAELHLMAASVTNVPSPEDLQRGDIQERLQSEAWAPLAVMDRVTHADQRSAPRMWTPRVRSNEAVSRLQEMDAQLQALQNMADGMEQDFANTKMLVNTLEILTSAVQPGPEDVPSRGARAPQTALPVSDLQLEDLTEEEEYNLTSPMGIGSPERPLEAPISSRGDRDHRAADGREKNMDERILQDALQMTGLSDIADILGDLLAGGVSVSDLGLTPAQVDKISRTRARGTSTRSPRERAELLRWMRKKQRERLAETRRRLQELREKEHNPFQMQPDANTSKAIREMQQVKNERDRSLLSEHHSHRVSAAFGLMQEMLSESKQMIPSTSSQPSTSRASVSKLQTSKSSAKGARGAVRSYSANQERRRSLSRGGTSQPRATSTPVRTQMRGTATFVLPKSNWDPKIRSCSAPSYSVHRQYDPTLPGDRLSQITRRGMLTARNRLNVQSKNTKPILKSTTKQMSRQDRSSSPLSQFGELQPEDDYERDIVSPWEIPHEINRILNSRRNSILSQGSFINGGPDSQNHNLDNSSESTGSILSKLDWKAIEDMVASVGSTET